MPGCVNGLEGELPNFKFFPVLRNVDREAGLCTRPIHYRSIGFCRQIKMSGDKVRVTMRFKNIFYPGVPFLSERLVSLGIPYRVNDGRFPPGLNKISRFREATRV